MEINGTGFAKFFTYLIGKIILAAVAVLFVIIAFFTGLHSTNVHVVVTDAFAKRASVILMPNAQNTDSEVVTKLFTADYIIKSQMLTKDINPGVEILSFNQRTDVPYDVIWPWQDKVVMEVTDRIQSVNINVAPGDIVDPNNMSIPSGVYEVTIIKTAEDRWVISDMDMKEEINIEYSTTQEDIGVEEANNIEIE